MAPDTDQLHSLCNDLATIEQLSTSSSQLDGISSDLEQSLRFAGAQLIQAAGILLELPQEIIAQAIVIFYRFYLGSEGGSFRLNALKVNLHIVPIPDGTLNTLVDQSLDRTSRRPQYISQPNRPSILSLLVQS